MNKKILTVFIIILLVMAGGVYFVSYRMGYKAGIETAMLASKVGAGGAVQNPLENMPETNPFGGVVNPFKELYKNPFR